MSPSRSDQDRRTGKGLWFRPSELTFLLIAVLLYFFNPRWDTLHFTHARVSGSLGDWFQSRASGVKNWMTPQRRLEEMQQTILDLETQLQITRAELRTHSLQVLENDALRSLFLLPGRTAYRYVHAEAVSWWMRRAESRMFVRVKPQDSGEAERFVGAPVIAPTGTSWAPVGRVIRVHADNGNGLLAEIMLLSDPQSSIGVMSADTPAYGSALLVGQGLDRMELNYAAQPLFLQALAPLTVLVTAQESSFPSGMEAAVLKPEGNDGALEPRPIVAFGDVRFVVILVAQTPSSADTVGAGR